MLGKMHTWRSQRLNISFSYNTIYNGYSKKAERRAILHVENLLHDHLSRFVLLLSIAQSHAIWHWQDDCSSMARR
jgi:hypothetical protein